MFCCLHAFSPCFVVCRLKKLSASQKSLLEKAWKNILYCNHDDCDCRSWKERRATSKYEETMEKIHKYMDRFCKYCGIYVEDPELICVSFPQPCPRDLRLNQKEFESHLLRR